MPNRQEHQLGGLIVGLVVSFIVTTYFLPGLDVMTTIGIYLVGIIMAVLGEMSPDTIEPATSWHHRSAFHSKEIFVIALGLSFFFYVGMITSYTRTSSINVVLVALAFYFMGYAMHLLQDSTTSMGLPSFGLLK